MKTVQLPLFPLHTVLYPGCPLPLRIFETRYLDMVSQCLKTESGFGVCLIDQGEEAGIVNSTVSTGVTAKIIDWDKRTDGLLGITVLGEERFRIASVRIEKSGLAVAKVELLPDEQLILPEKYQSLASIVERLLANAGQQYSSLEAHFTDASWVSWRLAELLPMDLSDKQTLLEMGDPLDRLEHLHIMLEGMEVV
ncbi:MAG TPA: peptidase S16 [Gammaproteobacteria bacterium]|nr:peptidase S16 [Gammaproteobacteria bacterium]